MKFCFLYLVFLFLLGCTGEDISVSDQNKSESKISRRIGIPIIFKQSTHSNLERELCIIFFVKLYSLKRINNKIIQVSFDDNCILN